MTSPDDLARTKLESSGITLEEAAYARTKVLSAKATKNLFPDYDVPSLEFQYLDPLGRSTSFSRYRLLGKLGGLAGQAEKPLRYVQLPNTQAHVYFPRVKNLDWAKLLLDPRVPLIITEGELKALKATLAGFPTLGLGGVWAFRSTRDKTFFIEELRQIEWSSRVVYIAYDSDVAVKPDVLRAQVALADELGALGAQVYDAAMPAFGDAKVGLDDFLVHRSVNELKKHLARSEPFVEVSELHRFNEEYLYVKTLDSVIELANRQIYAASSFRATIAANKKYERRKVNAQGVVVMEKRSLAKDWMEWPNRAQVEAMDYAPGEGILLYPGPRYNGWKGWSVQPSAGSVKPWKELLDYLMSMTEPEAVDYLIKWFAYPLQNPGAKMYTAVALWGASHGTGKTLLGESAMLIYGENGGLVGQEQLQSAYSSWLENRQFILGDEITGNESRQHADRLKGLITSNTITINKKYVPEYTLPNRVNFFFTSNHPDAFFLEPTDRRFLVLEAPTKPLPQAFYLTYDRWLRKEGGVGHLFEHLLRVKLGNFDPRAPAPITSAKLSMIEENKSDLAGWALQLKLNPDVVLKKFNQETERDVFTNQELLLFVDPEGTSRLTANALGRELKKLGFPKANKQIPLRTSSGTYRYYVVRNAKKWLKASAAELIAHIEKYPLQASKY